MKKTVFMICAVLFLGHLVLNGVTISEPNQSSKWCIGQKCKIEWVPGAFHSNYVGIVLLNQGRMAKTIVRKIRNQGRYDWTLPFGIMSGRSYQVQIMSITNSFKKSTPNFSITRCRSKGGPTIPKGDLCEENKNAPYCLKVLKFKLTPNGPDMFTFVFRVKNEGKKCLTGYHWRILDNKNQVITFDQGVLGPDGYMIHGNEVKTHKGHISKSQCKILGICRDKRKECFNIKLFVLSAEPGGQTGHNTSNWFTLDWGEMISHEWSY